MEDEAVKLWLITRTDETDYDETNAMLVRAISARSAKALALAKTSDWDGFRRAPLVVTEVTTEGKREVIIVDFLRG
jgi:hypothetical protein